MPMRSGPAPECEIGSRGLRRVERARRWRRGGSNAVYCLPNDIDSTVCLNTGQRFRNPPPFDEPRQFASRPETAIRVGVVIHLALELYLMSIILRTEE